VLEARAQGVLQVHLSVNADNPRALALYESLGFTAYGREPRALRVKEAFFDEILMALALDDASGIAALG
jgi:RimJ/RimL family protein N-acetyltransferase